MEIPSRKCLQAMRETNESGLTLTEVVVSLGLLAFILGVLAQFLYGGVRFWAKNDRAYLRQHQLRIIYQTLNHDLEAAFAGRFAPEIAMRGNPEQVRFWRETAAGLRQVSYRYDPERHCVTYSSALWGSDPEEKLIFKDITEWRFEYFNLRLETWMPDWESEQKAQLPSLVQVTLKTQAGNLGRLVFPIRVYRLDDLE